MHCFYILILMLLKFLFAPTVCRHTHLIQRIIPEIRNYFVKALTKANSNIQA